MSSNYQMHCKPPLNLCGKGGRMGSGGKRAGSGRRKLGKVKITAYVEPETSGWLAKKSSELGETRGKIIDLVVSDFVERNE